MATITDADLKDLVHDTTIADATAENIIDQAKNELNLCLLKHGYVLSAATGAAGSKVWTCTDEEKGAILAVAMEYYQYYKSSGSSSTSFTLSGMGSSTSTAVGGSMGRIHEVAEKLAEKLVVDMDVSVG